MKAKLHEYFLSLAASQTIKYEEEVSQMKSKYEASISNFLDQTAELKNITKDDSASYEQNFNHITTKFEEEMMSLTASHRAEYNKMKAELEKRIVDLSTQNEVVLLKLQTLGIFNLCSKIFAICFDAKK